MPHKSHQVGERGFKPDAKIYSEILTNVLAKGVIKQIKLHANANKNHIRSTLLIWSAVIHKKDAEGEQKLGHLRQLSAQKHIAAVIWRPFKMMDELKQRSKMVKTFFLDVYKLAQETRTFNTIVSHYQFRICLEQIIVSLVRLTLKWEIKTATMIGGTAAVFM